MSAKKFKNKKTIWYFVILLILIILFISSEIDRTRHDFHWDFYSYYSNKLMVVGLFNNLVRLTHSHHTSVFNADDFEEHHIIQKDWKKIQQEALELYSKKDELMNMSDIAKGFFTKIDNEKGKWKVFIIKWYDNTVTTALNLAPETCKVIDKCPNVRAAMFSMLEPGKRIPLHKGPFKGCLRYHLGLKIPKDHKNCYIEVDDVKYSWYEGEGLVFDDTYKHAVYNNTNEPRIILFVDIVRPMNYPMNKVNSFLLENASFASFIKDVNNTAEKEQDI